MAKKEVLAWAMYDFANTVFSALFVSFFYPFYVIYLVGGNEFQIGLVFGISLLFVGVLVPFLGNIADEMKRRKPFIILFTILCCLCTVLVAIPKLLLVLLFGFIANFSYHAALSFYNAMLDTIGGKKKGFVSGFGVAMGYLGTLLSLAAAYIVLGVLGWETLLGMQGVFITTALLFLVLSFFLFFGIREKTGNHYSLSKLGKTAKDTYLTAKKIVKESKLRSFLLSLFFYTNAINAVIIFLFLYARQVIGLSVKNFFPTYAIFAISAAAGSYFFGKLTDKIGAKKVLVINGLVWIGVILALLAITNYITFLMAGAVGSFMLGVTWTAGRPKLIKMVARKKLTEYFGFLELTNKVSGTIGPIVFGYLAFFFNYTAAVLSLIIFFLIGLIFLKWVPED